MTVTETNWSTPVTLRRLRAARRWTWAATIVGCAAVTALIVALQTSWNTGLVTYSASSDSPLGLALVTYSTTSGTEHSELALPWATMTDAPSVVMLVVQPIDGTAAVTCSISDGSKVLVTNSSDAPGAPATCKFVRKNRVLG